MNKLIKNFSIKFEFSYFYVTLLLFISLAIYYLFTFEDFLGSLNLYQRANYLSLFGLLLPDYLLDNTYLFISLSIIFLVSSIFWILHLLLPFSSSISAISFTLLISIYVEHLHYTKHMYHAVNHALIIFAVVYYFEHKTLKSIFRNKLWQEKCCPLWVLELLFYWAVITYTFSGIIKLSRSGLAWASGLPLQLWVFESCGESNLLSSLIIHNRPLASLMQIIALITESTCLLSLFSMNFRIIYGLALLSFHICNIIVLGSGFNFYGNIAVILISFILLPLYLKGQK